MHDVVFIKFVIHDDATIVSGRISPLSLKRTQVRVRGNNGEKKDGSNPRTCSKYDKSGQKEKRISRPGKLHVMRSHFFGKSQDQRERGEKHLFGRTFILSFRRENLSQARDHLDFPTTPTTGP